MVTPDWLSSFVRAARIRAGLTRQQLADEISYSLSWVARLERGGIVQPSPEVLDLIGTVLGLSEFEQKYLCILGGYMHPQEIAISEQAIRPYLDGLDQPGAFISSVPGESYFNKEFGRLLKGVADAPSLLHWFYESEAAREIVVEWEEVSHRFISWMRLSAVNAADRARLDAFLVQAMAAPEFQKRWRADIIPVDVSTHEPWRVLDLDNNRELKVDMRAWRPMMSHGMLLLGTVQL